MTTAKQQQEEMVNAFVAAIPGMQTDIALLKQDTKTIKSSQVVANGKSDQIIQRLDNLSVVSKADFDQFKLDDKKWKDDFEKAQDERFLKTETYIADKKPGINFSNALVSRWTTFLVLLLLVAAVVALIGHFLPIGG